MITIAENQTKIQKLEEELAALQTVKVILEATSESLHDDDRRLIAEKKWCDAEEVSVKIDQHDVAIRVISMKMEDIKAKLKSYEDPYACVKALLANPPKANYVLVSVKPLLDYINHLQELVNKKELFVALDNGIPKMNKNGDIILYTDINGACVAGNPKLCVLKDP